MMGYRSHVGFMLSIIFQMIGLLMLTFFGLDFSGFAVFIFAALIAMIASAEARKVEGAHLYAMASTLAGLVIIGLAAAFGLFETVVSLVVLNDAVCFVALGASDYRKRNIPRRLPDTSKDKIKTGEEAERIFKELEEEVKKAKTVKTENADVSAKKEEQKFSGVKGGKTFHLPSCSILLRQDPESYVHFSTRRQALAKGRRPCRVCNP